MAVESKKETIAAILLTGIILTFMKNRKKRGKRVKYKRIRNVYTRGKEYNRKHVKIGKLRIT